MATPLWVRCSTSRVSAIWVSHVPIWEISCPTKNSRKFLTDSDRNVVRTAVVIRPLTMTSYRERFVSLTKWASRGVGGPNSCPASPGHGSVRRPLGTPYTSAGQHGAGGHGTQAGVGGISLAADCRA